MHVNNARSLAVSDFCDPIDDRLFIKVHSLIMTDKLYIMKIILLLSLVNFHGASGYYPVVIIHGVLTGSDSMELITNRIKEVGYHLLIDYNNKISYYQF